ncbi:MAG: copper chaperone PCu(A)C [Betaproteobacteria bacterium]|nr:hypothetical protein FV185_18780 [Ferrovum sp. PN-J185]MDE1892446.1 copper chaperone PCu(A)C [Betaproteobacteria bacterium]MDE2056803.1 copper chaperone PCu(A)C [Betaproteobacteria bacterium]
MKKVLITFILLLITLNGFANTINNIVVVDAYARETAKGQDVGAVYISLKNKGNKTVKFIGASTPIANTAQIHSMKMNNNISSMKHEQFLEVPANGELKLLPGESHIMLMGLKSPLIKGQTFPLNLHFEGLQDLKIEVPIKSINVDEMKDMKM